MEVKQLVKVRVCVRFTGVSARWTAFVCADRAVRTVQNTRVIYNITVYYLQYNGEV